MSDEDLSEGEMTRLETYCLPAGPRATQRLIAEVRRHRAAQVAGREHVRQAGFEAGLEALKAHGCDIGDEEWRIIVAAIATRAAEQLVPLTRERALELVLAAIEEYARYAEGAPLGGRGDVACDVARRTAERLVGRAEVPPARSEF